MKLIALRIDEEEKARLEQLAEERNVTLSRALREGAALYLSDRRARAHRAKGGESTFLGIRRDAQGRVLNKPSKPTAGELAAVHSLRAALQYTGLASIRVAWDRGTEPGVVLGALGQWLSLVGRVYVSNPSDVGWSWFIKDYCAPDMDADAIATLCRQVGSGLFTVPAIDLAVLLDTMNVGLERFLEDAEHQESVRREVLPVWRVMEHESAQ